MRVRLGSEWDMAVIADSGQCFRMRQTPASSQEAEGPLWRVISREHVLYLAQEGKMAWVSASKKEWEKFWRPYFDADTDYEAFRCRKDICHPFMKRAFERGKGLRLLRQDPFEMLMTFLLSQRKSIPAIARNVEDLCRGYGKVLPPVEGVKEEESLYAFPEPQALEKLGEGDYREMGMGYRSPYLVDAVQKVCAGELSLEKIASLPTPELIEALQSVKGVGIKVASCVALFGYGRKDCAPVDVWIARAMEEEFGGEDPFPAFAPCQGLAQQYLFYYQKHKKEPNDKNGTKR